MYGFCGTDLAYRFLYRTERKNGSRLRSRADPAGSGRIRPDFHRITTGAGRSRQDSARRSARPGMPNPKSGTARQAAPPSGLCDLPLPSARSSAAAAGAGPLRAPVARVLHPPPRCFIRSTSWPSRARWAPSGLRRTPPTPPSCARRRLPTPTCRGRAVRAPPRAAVLGLALRVAHDGWPRRDHHPPDLQRAEGAAGAAAVGAAAAGRRAHLRTQAGAAAPRLGRSAGQNPAGEPLLRVARTPPRRARGRWRGR